MKKIFFLPIISSILLVSGCTWFSPDQEIITKPIQTKELHTQTIYALGDSLTAGYQVALEDAYPAQLEDILIKKGIDVHVVNAGKSGDTSAGLRARVARLTEEAKAGDIAMLVIGANDGMQSLPLKELQANLEEIITRLQQKEMRVVLGGMQLPTNLDPVYRKEFAEIFFQIGLSYDLPVMPFFLQDVATIPSLNLSDGIHPNKEGYSIIANNVAEFLMGTPFLNKE